MKEKSYKHRTKVMGLPVPGYKDRIWPELEMAKWQMVENMLLASLRGQASCIFDEGDLLVRKSEEGNWNAILVATGASCCVRGLAGGAYFDAPSRLEWEDLKSNRKNILYIEANAKTFADPKCVRTVFAQFPLDRTMLVKIAVVDLTGDKPVVDRKPAGKLFFDQIEEHVGECRNPHGRVLVQDGVDVDCLRVKGEMVVDGETFPASRVKEALNTGLADITEVIDFDAGGPGGVEIKAGGVVKFVMVSARKGGEACGNLGVGYYGDDDLVQTPDVFRVYNTNTAGIPLRALVVRAVGD